MVVIVDYADTNRCLVDGMGSFPRVMYPLKRLTLTRLRIPILRGARTSTLAKAAKAYGLDGKWAAAATNKKMQRFAARANTTDFDRFKIMIQRKQRSYEVKKIAHAKLAKK